MPILDFLGKVWVLYVNKNKYGTEIKSRKIRVCLFSKVK